MLLLLLLFLAKPLAFLLGAQVPTGSLRRFLMGIAPPSGEAAARIASAAAGVLSTARAAALPPREAALLSAVVGIGLAANRLCYDRRQVRP